MNRISISKLFKYSADVVVFPHQIAYCEFLQALFARCRFQVARCKLHKERLPSLRGKLFCD